MVSHLNYFLFACLLLLFNAMADWGLASLNRNDTAANSFLHAPLRAVKRGETQTIFFPEIIENNNQDL